ncbi:glycosyltransferase family 2 protein [Marinobacter nauticus]|uniref:glycosyltransferase family 2 protein n=1 Tax=Marinobacter nauticus TaxID=2743 RepID=UPI001D195A4C|nr:glycosyltransferase family 2 protein [Marinobacter nauticus]MCC4270460.1 glycosyltransferase family 2 protein [Marinobacter nauticus]
MKTRVVAIAKDEAAYLADWVFHHRYFGFDEVHVCLNRTTDQSAKVLDNIALQDPAVTYEYLDWVDYLPGDLNKSLQHIAYAKAFADARKDGVDWLIFLDVDEFWVPSDFKMSVKEHLYNLFENRTIGAVCYLWHNEYGTPESFSAIREKVSFSINREVKTLFPVSIDLRQVRIHCHAFKSGALIYDAEGNSMLFEENKMVARKEARIEKKFFILHRVYRSELEYLATLVRDNPEKDPYGLKRTRNGYFRESGSATICFPKIEHDEYIRARDQFIIDAELMVLLSEERESIVKRADFAKRILRDMLVEKDDADARKLARRLLRGVTIL